MEICGRKRRGSKSKELGGEDGLEKRCNINVRHKSTRGRRKEMERIK